MRFATFVRSGRRRVGIVSQGGTTIQPLELSSEQENVGVLSVITLLAQGGSLESTQPAEPLGRHLLEAPLPRPLRSLFCVGRNYRTHARELSQSVFKGNDAETEHWPIVFTKLPQCVVGPGDTVCLPHGVSQQIDYEAELAVVIGRGGRNIARSDAMSHVFGYTIVNDVTARDVQMRHQQWDLGKSFDTFCPMGPWIVTADELDGARARLQCWVNGELRQAASTEELIFDIPTLIETCSRGVTLYPGDVIATGTPSGVGMGMAPPRYLQPGDEVRICIDGIGEISNRFE